MNSKSTYFFLVFCTIIIFGVTSCAEINNFTTAKIRNPGSLLTSNVWELADVNNSTGNITIRFDISKNKKELVYSKTEGLGKYQRISIGTWKFNRQEKKLVLKELKVIEQKRLGTENFEIIHISKNKLILKSKDKIYNFKKSLIEK